MVFGVSILNFSTLRKRFSLAGSEREGCNPLSRFELFSDRPLDPAKFAKSFEVWPLQADLRQHF